MAALTENELLEEELSRLFEEAQVDDKTATSETSQEKICAFFQIGKCKKGDECNFLHQKFHKAPNSKPKTVRLCSFFNTKGGCRNGDSCPFEHGAINTYTPKFLQALEELSEENGEEGFLAVVLGIKAKGCYTGKLKQLFTNDQIPGYKYVPGEKLGTDRIFQVK
jgi:hypothetical protein